MYVLSTSQKRVSVEFIGKNKVQEKLKNLDELSSASVAYMGVSSIGSPDELKNLVPSKCCLMILLLHFLLAQLRPCNTFLTSCPLSQALVSVDCCFYLFQISGYLI
jgi:hypothetical protein